MADVRVTVHFSGDEFVVHKTGRERPVLGLVECSHGRACPYPLMVELPHVPNTIASRRVLQAMAVDCLSAWDPRAARTLNRVSDAS